MKHTILAVALLAAGILAACAHTSPQQTVYAMRASYDAAFLAPAAAYNELPRCPQAAPVCSDPGVVDQLRKADAAAKALLDGAEDVVRNHPELDAAAATAAAQNAVSAATAILTIYHIGGH